MLFQDADGSPINIQMRENADRSFSCVYVPTKAIKHTIIITWADANVPGSPFRVKAPTLCSRLHKDPTALL